MAPRLRIGYIVLMILVSCALQQTISAQAVSNTDCDPNNNDATNGGAAVCAAKDENAVCPAGAAGKCVCKDGYKEGGANNDVCVLIAVSEFPCDPNDNDVTTGGAAVCAAVDENAECPDMTDKCACKYGYKEGNPESNTCVLMAVTEFPCDPTDNDPTTGGAAVCAAVDGNAECPDMTDKCACKYGYKEGNPESSTCVLMAVSEFPCDPNDNDATTGESAVCKAVDANAECPNGEINCKCKSGYKQDETDVNTCSKVLDGPCNTVDDCTGTVANSECLASTCSCVAGYKEVNNNCEKVLTEPCTADVDCTGTVANSECISSTCSCVAGYKEVDNICKKVLGGNCSVAADCSEQVSSSECFGNKCSCMANHIEDDNICKKAVGEDCSSNEECVTNAECDMTCQCTPDYVDNNGSCVVPSLATSTWTTTGLLVTLMLVYLPRLINFI